MARKKIARRPGRAGARSAKASRRVTAPAEEASADAREAERAAQGRAAGAGAAETAAIRQMAKTRMMGIQAHIRARGQRQQASRDSR